ncbi:hypothetical protein AHiyo8_00480 [Arthrobacter sp. Hiyo8]|nr:hypothetical protein AHiyo8_00480 [Arthrobacter sp. Hiyo8]
MEPGESWAYRGRGVDPLVEVRVVRQGTQKPARVLVRFVSDEFEGKEEWVPPAASRCCGAKLRNSRPAKSAGHE